MKFLKVRLVYDHLYYKNFISCCVLNVRSHFYVITLENWLRNYHIPYFDMTNKCFSQIVNFWLEEFSVCSFRAAGGKLHSCIKLHKYIAKIVHISKKFCAYVYVYFDKYLCIWIHSLTDHWNNHLALENGPFVWFCLRKRYWCDRRFFGSRNGTPHESQPSDHNELLAELVPRDSVTSPRWWWTNVKIQRTTRSSIASYGCKKLNSDLNVRFGQLNKSCWKRHLADLSIGEEHLGPNHVIHKQTRL